MKKIFILGIVASGKTTLAKRLSLKLNIPWYELDAVVHNDGLGERIKRSPQEQLAIIQGIDREGPWIMEGTNRQSYQCLYAMADTIVFLDPPLWKRRIRIASRFMKQKLGLEACLYQPDWTMLKLMYKWTNDFERNRDLFEAQLQQYADKVIRLSDSNADTIARLENNI
jgi:adenylate kinase family enzyme